MNRFGLLLLIGLCQMASLSAWAQYASFDGSGRLELKVQGTVRAEVLSTGLISATGFQFADGTSMTTTSSGDDLGDHIATENIQLGSYYLSGDGDDEGVYVTSNGLVKIKGEGSGSTAQNTISLDPSGWSKPGAVQDNIMYGTKLDLFKSSNNSNQIGIETDGSMWFRTGGDQVSDFKWYTASANDTSPTVKMTLSNDGNVGIGTTSPSSTLHVVGNSHISKDIGYIEKLTKKEDVTTISSNPYSISLANTDQTDDNFSSIWFGDDHTVAASMIASQVTDHSNNYGNLHFYTKGSSGTGTRMLIEPNGNVGIGTTSPSSTLHIYGTSTARTIKVDPATANGNGTIQLVGRNSGTALTASIWADQEGGLDFQPTTARGYQFRKGDATNAMIIEGGGYVGIGLDNANSQLDVAGTISATGLQISGTGYLDTLYVGGSAVTGSEPTAISNGTSSITVADSASITFDTNGTRRMVISDSGRIIFGESVNATSLNRYSFPYDGNAIVDLISDNNETLSNSQSLLQFWINGGPGGGTKKGAIGYDEATDLMTLGYAGDDDIVINSSGNVGIGTTSPSSTLHVVGDGIFGQDVGNGSSKIIMRADSSVANDELAVIGLERTQYNPGENSAEIVFGRGDNGTNGNIRFKTQKFSNSLSEVMRIDNNGKVGISTTTPNAKLDVVGTVSATGLQISGTGYLDTLYVGGSAVTGGEPTAITNGTSSITVADSSSITFDVAGSRVMTLVDTAVGIGKDDPISPLHIYQNTTGTGASTGISIEQDGSGDALTQYVLTGEQRWVVGIDNSDEDKFKFASSYDLDSDARVTFDTSGNVGIGTTSPSSTLHVFATGEVVRLGNNDNTDTYTNYTGRARIGHDATYGAYIQNKTQGVALNATSDFGDVPDFFINTSGNVGIGTTSPSNTLHVYGGGSGEVLRIENNGAPHIRFQASTGDPYKVGIDYDGNFAIGVNNITTSRRFLLTPTGELGIGTVTPTTKLEVAGTISATGLQISGTGYLDTLYVGGSAVTGSEPTAISNGTSSITVADSTSITFDVAGSRAVTIGENGYVGIGTITPTTPLEVNGSAKVNYISISAFLDNAKALTFSEYRGEALSELYEAGDAGVLKLGYYGMGTDYLILNGGQNAAGARISGVNDGSDPGTFFISSRSSDASYINSGNFGIGTTSPSSTLHVAGAIEVISSTASSPGKLIIESGEGEAKLRTPNNANLRYDAYAHTFRNYDASTTFMRISTTGDVGIGTTSPNAKLAVVGTVSATGISITGDIHFSGDLYDISDRRAKTNIQPEMHGLETILRLKPVMFEMKNDRGHTEHGFIAQEVEQLLPELVGGDLADPEALRSLNYNGLIAPLVRAVQELKEENDALRSANDNRLQALEAANDNQTREIEALRAEIRALAAGR